MNEPEPEPGRWAGGRGNWFDWLASCLVGCAPTWAGLVGVRRARVSTSMSTSAAAQTFVIKCGRRRFGLALFCMHPDSAACRDWACRTRSRTRRRLALWRPMLPRAALINYATPPQLQPTRKQKTCHICARPAIGKQVMAKCKAIAWLSVCS